MTASDVSSTGRYRRGAIPAAVAALALAAPASAQAATAGARIVSFGIVANIATHAGPAADVAVNPATNMIYAAGGQTITVINGSTNTVVTHISVPGGLEGITVDPATDMVYAADSNGADSGGDVLAISGAANAVADTIPTGGTFVTNITCDPATDMIYVSALNVSGSPSAAVAIDGSTNTVVATVPGAMGALAADPATGTIYAGHDLSSTDASIVAISEATNTVVNTFPIPSSGMQGLAVNPGNGRLYATFGASLGDRPREALILNGQTGQTIGSIGLPGRPRGVAVNPTTGSAYVVNSWNKTVMKISGTTNKSAGKVSLPGQPAGVAVNPTDNLVYAPTANGRLIVLNG